MKRRKDQECYFWGNQYGYGIVLTGQLAEDVDQCCKLLDITPEEFLRRAVDNYYHQVMDEKLAMDSLEEEHKARAEAKS